MPRPCFEPRGRAEIRAGTEQRFVSGTLRRAKSPRLICVPLARTLVEPYTYPALAGVLNPADRPQSGAVAKTIGIGERTVLQLGPAFDGFDDWSENELLTLIGASAATPVEEQSAVLRMFGSKSLVARLEARGLITLGPSNLFRPENLISRGRRVVDRVVADWGDELRERICPLLGKGASEKQLAAGIVPFLLAHVALPHLAIITIAFFISRYLAQKLCEGWKPASA